VAHPYLKAQSLTHHFGGELLFRGVDLVVNPGDRIGLVGPNGVGKTTLLRVLAGELPPAGGHVTAGASIGWSGAAAQPDAGGGARTIVPYLAAGLGRLAVLAARMRTLEADLATADAGLLAEYARVQDEWSMLPGWTAEHRLAIVRDRLGLTHLPGTTPLATLSGGELARLTLARLLLAEPEVLILDEPTNHLDADGARWLGDYLTGFDGGMIVASHDRAFLDTAVNQIIELTGIDPAPDRYRGGYTDYRAEKARRWQRRLPDYQAQQKYRSRLEADVAAVKGQALATEQSTHNDRLRRYAKKVAKKAKARERRLERQIQTAAWLAEPQTRPPLVLALPPEPPAADGPVLAACDLSVSFRGRALLRDVSLEMRSGDRVLISGPNGAGKTTLLRVLAGQLRPDAGQVSGARETALLPQRHDDLPTGSTVLGYLRSRLPLYADEAEQLLAAYQFAPEQWRAPLRTLSDGEVRRLLLAAVVNSQSPVLLLDEPTHYLDFDALDVVEAALRAYPATLVMVTHDRYFADRVGFTRQLLVGNGRVSQPGTAACLAP
jgi:ATPase subunit of ABC transporter with duplicated ATPase domains